MPAKPVRLKPWLRALANPAWIAFLWFGLTAGISLLEAPVKFTAPAITREAALDVGRVVFAALNKAELVALVVLLTVVRASQLAKTLWIPCALLALILITQSAWLLPELAQRSQQILAGVEPPDSPVHMIYGLLEIAKLALLLYVGFRSLVLAGRPAP